MQYTYFIFVCTCLSLIQIYNNQTAFILILIHFYLYVASRLQSSAHARLHVGIRDIILRRWYALLLYRIFSVVSEKVSNFFPTHYFFKFKHVATDKFTLIIMPTIYKEYCIGYCDDQFDQKCVRVRLSVKPLLQVPVYTNYTISMKK